MKIYKFNLSEPFKNSYGKITYKHITYSNAPDFIMTCPDCGSKLVLRNGKYGEFYSCTNYNCKYTYNKKTLDAVIKSMERELQDPSYPSSECYSIYLNKYDGQTRLEVTY